MAENWHVYYTGNPPNYYCRSCAIPENMTAKEYMVVAATSNLDPNPLYFSFYIQSTLVFMDPSIAYFVVIEQPTALSKALFETHC